MRIALYVTCVNDALYPQTGRATVAVLERLGHEVVFPAQQTCCGQMHYNSGYRFQALALARRVVEQLSAYDVIVMPSASCAGTVLESYAHLAEAVDDSRLASDVRELALRVHEFSQLLVDVLGVVDVGASFPHRVSYHPTCHALRVLRVDEQPIRLLRAVAGLELVDFEGRTSCCGFGGTFSVKNSAVSAAMLGDKIVAVRSAGPEVLCALDNSCLSHIGGGMSRLGLGIHTLHLAEILAGDGHA
ncbi:MAG: (Fe-S)-binding protein [Acidimicrobiales bacterium]